MRRRTEDAAPGLERAGANSHSKLFSRWLLRLLLLSLAHYVNTSLEDSIIHRDGPVGNSCSDSSSLWHRRNCFGNRRGEMGNHHRCLWIGSGIPSYFLDSIRLRRDTRRYQVHKAQERSEGNKEGGNSR